MVQIGVYETNAVSANGLKELFSYYTFNRNTEMNLLWFTDASAAQKVQKYAKYLHIAFVNINDNGFWEFIRCLNAVNPSCRICCYQSDNGNGVKTSLPLSFLAADEEGVLSTEEKEAISVQVDRIIEEFRQMGNFLIVDTRRLLYFIPVENILYLSSDLKYVNIVLENGELVTVYKKLNDFEQKNHFNFVRVHKSYLINLTHVKELDKSKRQIVMDNDVIIPISNAHYNEVLQKFSKII